ncbi:hypothetical protein M440DRAFT_181067 [Trichoderma longibrachiatum ATCC 18648]|uniref:Uncharacterized protein n=1 Tax=Trichoderma longibrachiatum ATCC 18648 TaxID=983965 RepID=A0A2T4CEY3_TRILO|nr:hypothetical protein M440DRAFT_181067 [Trichoderma longibrachiatum ATCC 18648]
MKFPTRYFPSPLFHLMAQALCCSHHRRFLAIVLARSQDSPIQTPSNADRQHLEYQSSREDTIKIHLWKNHGTL